MTFNELKSQIDSLQDTDKAIILLNDYIEANPSDDEALTLRGIKHWSKGMRSEAINDYLAAIRINPKSKAQEALKATYDILDYYNKDLYNP